MGLTDILIGVFSVLVSVLYFRGNHHKKKSNDNYVRSEHYRKELAMKTMESSSLRMRLKIKDVGREVESEINSIKPSDERVDLGVQQSTARNSDDKT